MKKKLLRWIPLLGLIILLVLAISLKWYRFFSFDALAQNHHLLLSWTQAHYVASICIFMLVYIVAVAVSIPGATLLTLMGGYLFGIVVGSICVVISATLGSVCIFLAVKSALGVWLQAKAQGWVSKMERGFQKNALSYLLFLRLVPVFPFWVVNIVPALLNVRLRLFFFATFVGIIPGSVVFVSVGNGLGTVFEQGGEPNLSIIFKPSILVPILALAVLSLVPILYKKIRGKHDRDHTSP
ncbi:MAG: hypothetical protein COB66_03750 [Coxiella sp. (in: Bacteria)]|nr:MAG: hypothetical protein COB66_03750 [Coxiella sp. (in: g-proteobacteria)]